ncbi:MAG TPA: ATP synthase F0 subunit B, partial [Clostridiales bacterium]|nr:ATP synthase F0 subunit B [Clostridiales bacterium]
MSGLDKIVDKIMSAARNAADMKLNQARLQAEAMISEMEDTARKESERILQEAADKAADIIERARSAAALQKRRAILSAKQQII